MAAKIKTIICLLLLSTILPITPVYAETPEKLNVVMVIDISGSMKNDEKPYKVEQAVRGFVNKIPVNGSLLSVVVFTGEPDIIADKYVFNNGQDKAGFENILIKLNEKIDLAKVQNGGLNGTAVAKAMKQGDKLLADFKDNDEFKTAMFLYTDGVDSRSAPSDEEEVIDAFGNGEYGSYSIYVVEMPTAGANISQGERKMDLRNLGENNGGKWIEEVDVNNIPFRFAYVADLLLKTITSAQQAEPVETEPVDTPPPQEISDIPESIDIPAVSGEPDEITGVEIANSPVDRMFDDQELIVQGTLRTKIGNTDVVVGDEDIYNSYRAMFYIKNESDSNYRTTDMEIQGGSYKTRYQLPTGVYSFYIEIWQGDELVLASSERAITVLSSIPPSDLTLEISPENVVYQDRLGESGINVTFTASLGDVYDDRIFYDRYKADILVKRNNELIDKIPMDAFNQIYTASYTLSEKGECTFQAELLVDENTGSRIQSVAKKVVYKKPLPFFILLLELVLTLAIIAFIYLKREQLFPKAYIGFLIYDITDIYGSSKVSNTVQLKSYIGSLTLKDVLGSDCAKIVNIDWLSAITIKAVNKGISVAVKGNINTELKTLQKGKAPKKLLMQNGDQLILRTGDYKASLKYAMY